jgi:hypothetical protein
MRAYQREVRIVLPVLALAALCTTAAWAQQDASPTRAAAAVEEPTEEQIRSAYASALEDVNARSVAQLGAADAALLAVVLEDLTKLGCRGLGRPGEHYDCRVERRTRRGERGAVTDVVQLWLSYEDGRWVVR